MSVFKLDPEVYKRYKDEVLKLCNSFQKIDQPGLYPFVSHAFAHVDLGQVGLLKIGHPKGTMSH